MPDGTPARTVEDDSARQAREQAAAVAFRSRCAALENKVAAGAIFLGVIVGFLGLVVVREWESGQGINTRRGGSVGALVPAVLIGMVARLVARRVLRARRDVWIGEIAADHQVTPDALRAALVG